MSDEDLDLRPRTDEPIVSSPLPAQSQPGPKILAALLIVAVAVTGYFVFRNRGDTDAVDTAVTAPVEEAPVRSPLGTDADTVTLPPVDESDDAVRELARQLSAHPSVTAWLATKGLIRTFTVVVSNIATGEPAFGHVPALKPRGEFLVEERGEDAVINPRSYARYTALATALSSVDPAGAAMLYTTLKPRIEEAYSDLGYPDATFDQALERAIVMLLRTPVPSGRVAVHPAGVTYAFDDPRLQALTPSQKLLIRFGPDNQRAVQSSLRAIALALGIPPERLP